MRADLTFLKEQGWEQEIKRHLRFGGKVIGICGGYQMLGQSIEDPEGIEGESGTSSGLNLLNQTTVLQQEKTLTNVTGTLLLNGDTVTVKGYEIHVGETYGNEAQPIKLADERFDGAISQDDQVLGTYLHGLFDSPDVSEQLIYWATGEKLKSIDHDQVQENAINQIADAIEEHLDMSSIWPQLSKRTVASEERRLVD